MKNRGITMGLYGLTKMDHYQPWLPYFEATDFTEKPWF